MNKLIFVVCTFLVILSVILYFAFDGIFANAVRNFLLTAFLVIVYLFFQDANQDINELDYPI